MAGWGRLRTREVAIDFKVRDFMGFGWISQSPDPIGEFENERLGILTISLPR
jgi:hypothetical protein